MTDQSLMPFGKYKGVKMEDVPASYLLWLWDNGVYIPRMQHADLHAYIKDSFSALEHDAPDVIVKHRPQK